MHDPLALLTMAFLGNYRHTMKIKNCRYSFKVNNKSYRIEANEIYFLKTPHKLATHREYIPLKYNNNH